MDEHAFYAVNFNIGSHVSMMTVDGYVTRGCSACICVATLVQSKACCSAPLRDMFRAVGDIHQ